MSTERAAQQTTLLDNGQVLITGGCSGTGCEQILASAEIFDPSTQLFKPAASMATPRVSHAAVALPDGRVLVCGGWTGDGPTASAEIYDPLKDKWMPAGDMIEPRVSHIAVPLQDGRILIMGGGSGSLGDIATAEVFDPATSTFSSIGSMQTNHYLATSLSDGRVLLTGGQNEAGQILSKAEIFDPATDQFQPTGEMITPRVKHAAVLLDDGKVLILGGSDTRGYSARFNSTEIYDPASGTFSPGPALNRGRHKLRDAVVKLPSGAVLVAGGAVSLELFDPEQQAFIPIEGKLSGPQMFATATLLPDGNVLVLGGYDDHTRSSSAAWLVYLGHSSQ